MTRKEREIEVIRLYAEENKSCTQIAKAVSIQRRNVYRILERNNIKLKEKTYINCSICEKEILNNNRNRSRCQTCSTKVRRYVVKKTAVEYLGDCCSNCGWSGDISGYDFHHRNPEQKSFGINAVTVASKKWEEVKSELDKCDLLCALCHRLEHSDYKNESLLVEVEKYKGIIFKE